MCFLPADSWQQHLKTTKFIKMTNERNIYFLRTLHDTELVVYAQGFGPAFAKRGRDMPSLDVIKYNASLMLGNSHVSSGNPVSLPQNYKAIGGYHIEENTKPLPKVYIYLHSQRVDTFF